MMMADQETMEYLNPLALAGKLFPGAAHDMRNPLASIKGLAQVINLGLASGETLKNYSASIMESADKLDGLIRGLLLLTASLGEVREIELTSFLKNISSLFRKELSKLDAKLEIIPPGQPAVVRMPESDLQIVVANILINAAESNLSEGIIRINIKENESGDAYLVVFTDNGSGIESGVMDKIFLPGFTTKPNHLGIGLTYSQNRLWALGGDIAIESRQGLGTTVTISLPKA